MATFTASTPSPPPTIRTPDTPRFGYGDSWEPYSPRKSARISSQRQSSARTPSPKPQSARSNARPPRFTITRSSPKDQEDKEPVMASPAPSPRKRQHLSRQTMLSSASASDALTAEGTRRAAAFLGPPPGGKHESPAVRGSTSISAQAGMLPTPSKTPSRKHAEQNEANIAAIARNLFHSEDDEVMPNPKQKRPTKYTGISMDSFTAVEVDESIQIFTDSRDRIPEVDPSADNPFYGDQHPHVAADPVRRRSKRRTVVVPGEGTSTVDEALHRDDGLVYVFRGKKIFRKFADKEDEDLPEENGEGTSGVQGRRMMTRSSMKPRLLFPPEPKTKQLDSDLEDEEEAVTDIEDHVQSTAQPDQQPATPSEKIEDKAPATPDAPRFAPYSPPGTTGRVTRSAQRRAEEATPLKHQQPVRKARGSPFDSWQRVKSCPGGSSSSHKRPGDPLSSDAEVKRTRC